MDVTNFGGPALKFSTLFELTEAVVGDNRGYFNIRTTVALDLKG